MLTVLELNRSYFSINSILHVLNRRKRYTQVFLETKIYNQVSKLARAAAIKAIPKVMKITIRCGVCQLFPGNFHQEIPRIPRRTTRVSYKSISSNLLTAKN